MRFLKQSIAVLLALVSVLLLFVPAVLAEEHVHEWNEGTVVREGTCSQQEVTEYECVVCHQKRRELTGYGEHLHTHVVGERAATCTTKGYTGDTYCDDCGKQIAAGKEIDFAAHTPTEVTTVAPTCTEAGYDESVCAVCNMRFKSNKVEALGHTDADKDAKCDRCGTSLAYAGSGSDVCKVCGRVHNLDLADRLLGAWHTLTYFFNNLWNSFSGFFQGLGK